MSAPARRVAGVILAAGEGRRFGGAKLLAPVNGQPLVQHVLDAANASSLDPLVLVIGFEADALLAKVRLGRAREARNTEYASGQASSIAAGVRAAGDVDAVVVLLGDQPRVTAALLDALVERQRETAAAAVLSSSEGRRSPPTLLHRDLFPAVLALRGDVGARDVIKGRDDVAFVEVAGALGSLDDVDTREDHQRVSGG